MSSDPYLTVLASASPARRRLLQSAGVEPRIMPADVDEERIESQMSDHDVGQVALAVARAKADVIGPTLFGHRAVVIAADSIFEFAGQRWGKPLRAEVARARLEQMSGNTGRLITGHVVIDATCGEVQARAVATTIHFSDMSPAEIDGYVASGEPLHVAGSFTLDGRGSPFIPRIEGDPMNVVGLSLVAVREMLADLGISWQQVLTTPEATIET